jgi:hypothetical protein
MSGLTVIELATRRLRRVIWEQGFAGEAPGPLPDEASITLGHPADPAANQGARLSLWLYRISENEFVRNRPLAPLPEDPLRLVWPPLPLNLFYLLTPVGGSEETRQQLLGRAMHALGDNPVVHLEDANAGTVRDELHLTLCRVSLEDTTRIWEALQIPFRLAVSYEARLVRLSSERQVPVSRIRDRRIRGPEGVA